MSPSARHFCLPVKLKAQAEVEDCPSSYLSLLCLLFWNMARKNQTNACCVQHLRQRRAISPGDVSSFFIGGGQTAAACVEMALAQAQKTGNLLLAFLLFRLLRRAWPSSSGWGAIAFCWLTGFCCGHYSYLLEGTEHHR